jgi:hypothetical protein
MLAMHVHLGIFMGADWHRRHLVVVADVLLQQQAVHLAVRVLRRDLVPIERPRLGHLDIYCGNAQQRQKHKVQCNTFTT